MSKEYIFFDDEDIQKLIKGETVKVKRKNGEELHFKYKPVMTAQMTAQMTTPVEIQIEQPAAVDKSLEDIVNNIHKGIIENQRRRFSRQREMY